MQERGLAAGSMYAFDVNRPIILASPTISPSAFTRRTPM